MLDDTKKMTKKGIKIFINNPFFKCVHHPIFQVTVPVGISL